MKKSSKKTSKTRCNRVPRRNFADKPAKQTAVGIIRIKTKTLKTVQKTKAGWNLINKDFPNLINVVKLFKAARNFKTLIDTKNPGFLKGQISNNGQVQGARINVLPTGEILNKAFSLFSPNLRIHDQSSHDHWDVLYQNKGGTWSYVYTKEKIKKHRAKKYKKVENFEKHYSKLQNSVRKALSDKTDIMALPMYTLLKTKIRVGNETYFKAHKHKGLTTLTKTNVRIKKNRVEFNFVGKDGVPISTSYTFPKKYIKRLQSLLKKRKKDEYLFSTKKKKSLREEKFKKAFKNYCGEEFYPHIIRSYYATKTVKHFLKNKRRITKQEKEDLLLEIAHTLGHKKLNKKTNKWQDSYTTTINSYIQPKLIEILSKRVS